MRALPDPPSQPVPTLGVEEFALRRRRTYATILVGMNTHRPADVLADRTAHTFAGWLRDHPEVRTICRDRAGSFRDGAHAGAPQARQVAEAWHLLLVPAAQPGRSRRTHRRLTPRRPARTSHGPNRPKRRVRPPGHR
ncbi:transposase [Streptomyces sp. NPDC041068]|uniref:transposase n=1 Tax=Streptomyces sp. NPDC041068 TaxID=3155130 RepID=UPI0033F111AA